MWLLSPARFGRAKKENYRRCPHSCRNQPSGRLPRCYYRIWGFFGWGVLGPKQIITPVIHIASRVAPGVVFFTIVIRYVAFWMARFWARQKKRIISDVHITLRFSMRRDFIDVIISYDAFPDGSFWDPKK